MIKQVKTKTDFKCKPCYWCVKVVVNHIPAALQASGCQPFRLVTPLNKAMSSCLIYFNTVYRSVYWSIKSQEKKRLDGNFKKHVFLLSFSPMLLLILWFLRFSSQATGLKSQVELKRLADSSLDNTLICNYSNNQLVVLSNLSSKLRFQLLKWENWLLLLVLHHCKYLWFFWPWLDKTFDDVIWPLRRFFTGIHIFPVFRCFQAKWVTQKIIC